MFRNPIQSVVFAGLFIIVLSAAEVPSSATDAPLYSRVVSAEIRGYVFYADGQTPASGVPVRIWDIDSEEFIYEVETDRQGFYELPKLQSGRYYLTFDWTKIELVVVDSAGGLAQQPHDVIAIIPRGFVPLSITGLSALLLSATILQAAVIFDDEKIEDVVSP